MSEKEKDMLDALKGGASAQVNWEERYNELKAQYDHDAAMIGRAKKMDEAIKERDRRIAELETARRNDEIASALSAEEKADIPDEVLNAATKLVGAGMKKMQEQYDTRFREIEERTRADRTAQDESARRAFIDRVNSRYPGFMASVTDGGDKVQQWATYQRFNAGSINAAIASHDFDTLAYHIEHFYSDHLGVQVPSGEQDGSAAPDPRTSGGGSNGAAPIQGKVYTQEEFLSLYDKVEEARSKGDYAEMKRLNAEISKAQAEGRVK